MCENIEVKNNITTDQKNEAVEWIPTERDLTNFKNLFKVVDVYWDKYQCLVNLISKLFMHITYPNTCKHEDADMVVAASMDFRDDLSYCRFIHTKMMELYCAFKNTFTNNEKSFFHKIEDKDILEYFHNKWIEENPEIDESISEEVEALLKEAEAEAAEE